MSTKLSPQPPEPGKPAAPRKRGSKLHSAFAEALRGAWHSVARPEQLPPPGAWTTWIFCAGRGSGKTRSGGEWVQERVQTGIARYVHLVAPTAADARDVMLEGPAGILSIASSHMRPVYQPSLRKLVWPNGAQALLFSSDEPDRLRGPQADTVWIDELCAMRQAQEVLDNMYFGLRVGKDPRCLITTTPRPLKCFKALLARDGLDVVVTRSSSYANRENLAPAFFASIVGKYAGTRLGRQELEAELLTDTPGALWHLERIEELRVRTAPPFERVVVAIDPAVTFGPDSDETGIIVVGLGRDGQCYVLDDLSGRMPPEEWARKAILAYRGYAADRIIAEINNGGQLVETTLRSVDASIPFRAVHASRAKMTRAEPVSALYEQGRVHHVGVFGPLEDQLTSYDGSRQGSSPDRLDALCWGIHELMLGEAPGGFFKESALLVRSSADGAPDASALGAPVEVPDVVDTVYAVAGFSVERDALAVVYFAYGRNQRTPIPLVVLEWELRPIEGALPAWLPTVFERLVALATRCKVLYPSGVNLYVVPVGVGAALAQQALETGHYNVMAIGKPLASVALGELAIAASAYVTRGQVKLSAPAHEQVSDFKGTMKNHLLSQITSYGITTPEPAAAELFTAWCYGILIALENPRRK